MVDNAVSLRRVGWGDLVRTKRWRNDDRIRKGLLDAGPVTWWMHLRWFANYMLRDNDRCYIIMYGKAPVGHVGLSIKRGREAEFGRLWIGEEWALGKNVATRATILMLRIARVGGLKVLNLTVMRDNAAALAVYRKCGFRTTEVASSGKMQMEIRL